jgi:hypothetical protein
MPASFQDLLGEQMQIHEITKRTLAEAGFAQGLATGLGSALSKVGVAGPAMAQSEKTGPNMNRADALKMGQKLTQTLMPVMMKNWTEQVQAAMAQSKDPATGQAATSPAMLTPTSQNTLKAALDNIIGQAIQPKGGFDYNKLEQYAGEDAVSKSQAQVVTQAIQAAADQIFKAAIDPKGGVNTAQAWRSLMTDGIAPAQGIIAFEQGSSGGVGKPRFGTGEDGSTIISIDNGPFVKYDPVTNPEHKAINDKMLAGKL